MRRYRLLAVGTAITLLACGQGLASEIVTIAYQATNVGAGYWQYTYEVTNDAMVIRVQEFTIWFELGDYANLLVATPDPPAGNWDELVVQPDPLLGDDGFYDALALGAGIDVGETVSGFTVRFNWLGVGQPGPQVFEVIDPVTFQTIHTGVTIPEPAAVPLLAMLLALVPSGRQRRARQS